MDEVELLRKKIEYYEEAVPEGTNGCYHKFTDDGICIRCGEDAENWDVGCVERILEQLMSLLSRDIVDALRAVWAAAPTVEQSRLLMEHADKIEKLLPTYWGSDDGRDLGTNRSVDDPGVQPSDDFTLTL